MTIRRFHSAAISFLMASAASLSAPAFAQGSAEAEDDEAIRTAKEIVVIGGIGFRNRTEAPEPVLVYDEQYFQRFEPLTAGDALKRVPSVTFLSDVIESDGARLRGLDPGYTQILINGDKVPGSNADRSFFLDRIPAELIKQVEIVRSSSARRTGDAVAGTLNIVLRDGYQLDGGYFRAGGLRFDDGEIKPSFGAVYGGEIGPGRILFGANIQGRYNPKLKKSFRYNDSPENNPNFVTDDFDNREDQTDTREGTDYAFNATYDIKGEKTGFEVSGYFVKTDRKESERSAEYDHPTNINGPVRNGAASGNLLTDNANVNEIDQVNYSVSSKISHEWSAGKTQLKLGYSRFKDEQYEFENEIDFDRASPRLTADLSDRRIVDKELSATLEHSFDLSDGIELTFGSFFQNKDRDTSLRSNDNPNFPRNRRNLTNADRANYSIDLSTPNTFVTTQGTLDALPGGVNTIEEDRRDAFAEVEGKSGNLTWVAGVRYETTDFTINDRTVAAGIAVQKSDYSFLLPSASLKYEFDSGGRITASVARTNRRPRLDFLSPATLTEELADNDLRGNPLLKPETAWGGDLGYEHKIGRTGVIGVNFFYRKVQNLIELANTGLPGSADDPTGDRTFIYEPRNTGDGKVYGVEFDLSTSLSFIGLPNTGVFGNFSMLDSKITDEFGKRRFNGQSKHVYNFGMIQDIPSIGAAFGATYRKQGSAFDRVVGEEVVTTYGADLELFVEKKFGERFTIRAVGSNLLNGKKREAFNKFATRADQIARDFDEYELEAEKAGPVFQIIARLAF